MTFVTLLLPSGKFRIDLEYYSLSKECQLNILYFYRIKYRESLVSFVLVWNGCRYVLLHPEERSGVCRLAEAGTTLPAAHTFGFVVGKRKNSCDNYLALDSLLCTIALIFPLKFPVQFHKLLF
jgi:hypothetical protein